MEEKIIRLRNRIKQLKKESDLYFYAYHTVLRNEKYYLNKINELEEKLEKWKINFTYFKEVDTKHYKEIQELKKELSFYKNKEKEIDETLERIKIKEASLDKVEAEKNNLENVLATIFEKIKETLGDEIEYL